MKETVDIDWDVLMNLKSLQWERKGKTVEDDGCDGGNGTVDSETNGTKWYAAVASSTEPPDIGYKQIDKLRPKSWTT